MCNSNNIKQSNCEVQNSDALQQQSQEIANEINLKTAEKNYNQNEAKVQEDNRNQLDINIIKENYNENIEYNTQIAQHIEINNDSLGKPEVILHGTLENKRNNMEIYLTISHCKEYGTATAIIISK